MPRAVRLTATQQRLLEAGEPPRGAAAVDDDAWHGQQDQWYADAVAGGMLPPPPAKQRRALWQQATTRFWRACRASQAANGGSDAIARRAQDAAGRSQRKRPAYTRHLQQHVVVQVGRKAAPPAGFNYEVNVRKRRCVVPSAGTRVEQWTLDRPPRLADDFASDRLRWEHARAQWHLMFRGSELPIEPDERIAAWERALKQYRDRSSKERESA